MLAMGEARGNFPGSLLKTAKKKQLAGAYREVSEWSKEHAWKVCIPLKGIGGSNPFLSADNSRSERAGIFISAASDCNHPVIFFCLHHGHGFWPYVSGKFRC